MRKKNYNKKRTTKTKIRKKGIYRKKRAYKKKARNTSFAVKIPGRGLPERVLVKLQYNSLRYSISLSSPGTRRSFIVFRGNSPFDPEWGIGGNQPIYYDFWRYAYQRVKCFGSRISAQIVSQGNTSTNFGQPVAVTYIPSPELPYSPSSAHEFQDITAQKYAKQFITIPNNNNLRTIMKTPYMSTAKIHGVPRKSLETKEWAMSTDDGTFLDGSSTAMKRMWFHNFGFELLPDSTTFSCFVYFKQTFYLEFSTIRPMEDSDTFNDIDTTQESMTGTYGYYPSGTGINYFPQNLSLTGTPYIPT